MKREQWEDAVGKINPAYIREAEQWKKLSRRTFLTKRVLPMAACICVLLTGAAFGWNRLFDGGSTGDTCGVEMAAENQADRPESAQDTAAEAEDEKENTKTFAEDEAEIIRIIFDKYIHTNMGVNGIAAYLNEHGYKKKKRQNNTLDAFATSFIKGVLDNPIYCGKLAFGRRKTERVPGKRNEFRIVKQDSYILSDGIHEAIISEDDWNLAKQKRNINGVKHEKIHSLEHEHILSGILKCPICGKGMYGNVNRKKKKDGTFYKDYFYYACKHRYYVNGHKCDYRKQWNEEKVNDAVAEVIKKLVNNPKFEAAIRAKINSKIDTGELETEHENLKKQLRQVLGAKNRLGQQMDNLDISDKMYDRKYQDMQDRLNGLYDEIERLESLIDDIVSRKEYIHQQKISDDGVYQ